MTIRYRLDDRIFEWDWTILPDIQWTCQMRERISAISTVKLILPPIGFQNPLPRFCKSHDVIFFSWSMLLLVSAWMRLLSNRPVIKPSEAQSLWFFMSIPSRSLPLIFWRHHGRLWPILMLISWPILSWFLKIFFSIGRWWHHPRLGFSFLDFSMITTWGWASPFWIFRWWCWLDLRLGLG